MILNVDFKNSDRDANLEKSIIQIIKERFTQAFISSINILIKRDKNDNIKSEIDLISHQGSIVHIHSIASNTEESLDKAIKNLEKQVLKLKNEKGKKRA